MKPSNRIDTAVDRASIDQLRTFARVCAYAVFPEGDPDIDPADGEEICGSDVIAEVCEAVHELM